MIATIAVAFAIHVRGDRQCLTVRLRELAQVIDPALCVIGPKPLPCLAETQDAFWFQLSSWWA